MNEIASEHIIDSLAQQLVISPLFTDAAHIDGAIYRGDEQTNSRPRDSRKEDIVVYWTAGTSDHVAVGFITLNIFVPDVQPFINGVYVANTARLRKVQELALASVKSLRQNPIQYNLDEAVHTSHITQSGQHFVVVKLKYRYINL